MAKELNVKVEGDELVVRIPMNPVPVSSASGKTLVVASTHGNKVTEATVNGQKVTLGLNAYIKK